MRLMARATEPEAAFLVGLLTGGLRQGALAGLMADAVAKAAGVRGEIARRALMLSGDLTQMARIAITGGEAGLRAVGFEIFRPILPMLASTGANVTEALDGFERASVEFKLDGIRIQIHRRGDEVRIYTRNLNEITDDAARDRRRGPPAAGQPGGAGRRGHLDGRRGPAPFQYTVSQIDSGAPPEGIVTFLFDVLHVDGEDLLDTPLHERIARLVQIAPGPSDPGRLHQRRRRRPSACSTRRSPPATRASSSRTPPRCTPRGGAARRGARSSRCRPMTWWCSVPSGAMAAGRGGCPTCTSAPATRSPATFVMVGKTFKGLTDELLRWQTEALLALETERRGIAVMVRPELVVEIALDGVQSSTRYPGGIALRFARVKRYRTDKDALQADVIGDLRALLPTRS